MIGTFSGSRSRAFPAAFAADPGAEKSRGKGGRPLTALSSSCHRVAAFSPEKAARAPDSPNACADWRRCTSILRSLPLIFLSD